MYYARGSVENSARNVLDKIRSPHSSTEINIFNRYFRSLFVSPLLRGKSVQRCINGESKDGSWQGCTRRQYPWRDVVRTYTRRNLSVTVLDGGLNLQSCRCKNVTRRRLYTASDSFGSKDTILIQRLPLLLQCIKYRKFFFASKDSCCRRRGYRLSCRVMIRHEFYTVIFAKSSRSRPRAIFLFLDFYVVFPPRHPRERYNTKRAKFNGPSRLR